MASFDVSNLDQPADTYKSGLENLEEGDTASSALGLGSNASSLMTSALQAFQGFTMMNSGISMIQDGAAYQAGVYRSSGQAAKQGADFQAGVDRQAGAAAIVSANYNIALDQIQTNRQQDVLGRQLKDLVSSNTAITGSSGLGFGSKSAIMVNNTVLDTVGRQFVNNSNDALQRQSLQKYQGQLVNYQYQNEAIAAEYSGDLAIESSENQARGAEYSGDVASYKLEQQSADQIGGAVGNIFKSFGGV